MDTVPIQVNLPKPVHTALKLHAVRTGKKLCETIVEILAKGVDDGHLAEDER